MSRAPQEILDQWLADYHSMPMATVVELVQLFKDNWAHEQALRDIKLSEAIAAKEKAEAVSHPELQKQVVELAMLVRRLAAQVPPCPQKTAAMGYLERHGLYAVLRRGPAA